METFHGPVRWYPQPIVDPDAPKTANGGHGARQKPETLEGYLNRAFDAPVKVKTIHLWFNLGTIFNMHSQCSGLPDIAANALGRAAPAQAVFRGRTQPDTTGAERRD